MKKPLLHTGPLSYPEGTYYEAGYLTQKNAGWRSVRPIVDTEKCIGCLQCYLYCPDGTVAEHSDGKICFDYDFCKGCGICAKICPIKAITMSPELEVAT